MTNSSVMDRATEVRFSLHYVTSQEIEALVQYWGDKSGLKDKVLTHLIFAVNEVVEAIVTLSRDLYINGELVVEVVPYAQWLTVALTFPREVPLDPTFNMTDEVLQEFPRTALHPDIFWRRLIMKWVDKATWEAKGKKTSLQLTQYARREGHPGELYFLNLTPRPVEDLHLSFLSEDTALALSPHLKSAFRVPKEAAFVLQAADGRTSVRDLYRPFVQEFGLVHPYSVGGLIEDLSQKGLINFGQALGAQKAGFWKRLKPRAERVLTFQYSTPNPDALMDSLNRWLGWLWSAPAAWIYIAFVVFSLWFFGFDLSPGEHIFVQLYHTPSLLHPLALLGLFWGLNVTIVIHELSHAMACKRLGGGIFAFGLMLYYGSLAAYCDTSDAWRFRNKWHRILVSLAGPFSTLIMGCLWGWANYFCTRLNHPTLGVFFGALAFISMLLVVFNLIPFLELDGYYMLADLAEIPNLKKKAFSYMAALGKKFLGKGELPSFSRREKVVFLIYGWGSPLFALFVIILPIYEFITGRFRQSPHLLVYFGLFLVLLFVFQRVILAGIRCYCRRRLVSLDLKT